MSDNHAYEGDSASLDDLDVSRPSYARRRPNTFQRQFHYSNGSINNINSTPGDYTLYRRSNTTDNLDYDGYRNEFAFSRKVHELNENKFYPNGSIPHVDSGNIGRSNDTIDAYKNRERRKRAVSQYSQRINPAGRSRAPTLASQNDLDRADVPRRPSQWTVASSNAFGDDIRRRFVARTLAADDVVATDVPSNEADLDETEAEQELHIHALSSAYESINYDLMENVLLKDEEYKPHYQVTLYRQAINRWVVCMLIGILTALIACAIDVIVDATADLKFQLILGQQYNKCVEAYCLWSTVFIWMSLNIFFVIIACSLVVFFAGPVAAGSGIPQIKCFLNGIAIPGVVRLKTLFAKALGVAFSVSAGLSVGKEGPMIHSGSVVAAGISQGRCITFPFDFGIFEYFRNDREKRDFVSAGAAAGVAAAFGAPIGGVLFSLEEGASFWNQSLTWRMFFASMVSAFTLSLVMSIINGHPGLLSWNGLANFGTFDDLDYNWWELIIYIIMGMMGGLSGAFFNYLNTRLTMFRQQYVTKAWKKFIEAIIVAACSCTAAFLLIYFVEDCLPVEISNETVPIQVWCPDGSYSTIGQLFLKTPEGAVKALFHDPPGTFSSVALICFTIVYWLLTCWTYGVSVPSGLFIPSLLVGAAWGRLVGVGVNKIVNAIGITPLVSIHPGKFAFAGAAAQLGGVVRMTISLATILLEATKEMTFGLPIILILLFAKWVGDFFNEGLYDIHIHLNEIPLLGWDPPKKSLNITAQDVMGPWKVISFKPWECLDKIVHYLKHTRHHGFPVIDDENRLRGIILRSQLLVLLEKRIFQESSDPKSDFVAGAQKVALRDFNYSRLNISHLSNITEDELTECYINIEPYMHPSPVRVPLNATLHQIFNIFRGLGLRYIIVVNQRNEVVGIVTRKDIARWREFHIDGEYTVEELPINVMPQHHTASMMSIPRR